MSLPQAELLSDIERLIGQLDPQSAQFATAALDWLLPQGGDLSELTQLELQDFLWLQLPASWPVPIGLQLEVAQALADLFALAGRERLAEVCRAQPTRAMFAAWAEGMGLGAYRFASQASGVEPPDTSQVVWSHLMGTGEGEVRREIGRLLEADVLAGRVVPDTPGWLVHATRLTDEFVTTPQPAWPGRTPLTVVREARVHVWLVTGNPGRRALLEPVAELIRDEPAVGADALALLGPLAWLLERFRADVCLTRTGRLPLSVVLPAVEHFGAERDRPPRSERELPELSVAFALLRSAGLVDVDDRRAYVTAQGYAALSDRSTLWNQVLAEVFGGDELADTAIELASALLVRYGDPIPLDLLLTTVHTALAGECGPGDATIGPAELAVELEPWLGLAERLGCLRQDAVEGGYIVGLTPVGRDLALGGLRARALRPRRMAAEEDLDDLDDPMDPLDQG